MNMTDLTPAQENSVRLAMLVAKNQRLHEQALHDAWEAGWEACANYVQDGDSDPKYWASFHKNPYRRHDED